MTENLAAAEIDVDGDGTLDQGQNHGLVHYYFGSVDKLLLQTLERFTSRILDRQWAMYETDAPFSEKWRTAMGYIEQDLATGTPGRV